MAKIATKLEDIGDERDQAVFMATVKLWFNGDFQAALNERNRIVAELYETEYQPSGDSTEVNLRFKH